MWTSPGLREAIEKRWAVVLLAHVDWPDNPVWIWDGVGELRHGGETYEGIERAGTISGIGASKRVAVRQVIFRLSGAPTDTPTFLVPEIRGRAARAWLAGLRPDGKINGDPSQVVDGRVDYREKRIAENLSAELELTISEPVFLIERAQNIAWTPEWFKAEFGEEIAGADRISGLVNANKPWTLE